MWKHVRKSWEWAVRAEEARAIYTLVYPMIATAIGGSLAAFAMQAGWVVWLVAINSLAAAAVARYFIARYISERSLKGNLIVACDGVVPDGTGTGTVVRLVLTNHVPFSICVRLKGRYHHNQRVYEDVDFDPPQYIPKDGVLPIMLGPIKNDKVDDDWLVSLQVMYGRDNDHLDVVVESVFKGVPGGYHVTKMEYRNA